MARAGRKHLIDIDLLWSTYQAELEGETLLTEWRRELATRRLRPGWLPEPPKSTEKYSENRTEAAIQLLNEVQKDLKTSILTLQRKQRRVTTILKQIEFKSGKPGWVPTSTLKDDALTEKINFAFENPGKKLRFNELCKRLAPKHLVNPKDKLKFDQFVTRVKKALQR